MAWRLCAWTTACCTALACTSLDDLAQPPSDAGADTGNAADAASSTSSGGTSDAGTETDASAIPGIWCNTTRCAPGVACCAALSSSGGSSTGGLPTEEWNYDLTCKDTGCAGTDVAITCSSTESCAAAGAPNTVCCGRRETNGKLQQVTCLSPTVCFSNNNTLVTLCDPQKPTCRNSYCRPSATNKGLFICSN